jgi:hypothetical protein
MGILKLRQSSLNHHLAGGAGSIGENEDVV